MENKRNTVGKISSDLLLSKPGKISVVEQQREMTSDYMKHLLETVDRGQKKYPNDFFVEVITKTEPLMKNVLRNYFIDRLTCPTPNYDQAVFRYNNEAESVEFIWVIPSRDACFHLKNNAVEVHPDEKELLKCVLDFDDGTLFKMCKKFNNEKEDSTLLERN